MAEVGSPEVGWVQRIAVEPHLTSCSVEVLPEGEWQVEVVTKIDETVAASPSALCSRNSNVAERSTFGRRVSWTRAALT
ncbi:hypothetical protein AB0G87_38320 [Streptomyces asoensis]|uniref:hypothetical protein n=1 Tax=Streptomyces asoensis TaxID=249586 RepID=UPI0033D0C299